MDLFNKISTWNKWDLHLHTRASKNRKGNSEYFGEGNSFADIEIKDFVEKVFYDDGPNLIAITDHDYFDVDQFKKIKEKTLAFSKTNKKDYNVLPGVELDVKFKLNQSGELYTSKDDGQPSKDSRRVHCVVIFNDDKDETKEDVYKKIYETTNALYPVDDTPKYIDTVVQSFVDAKLPFILIPHFDKNNGIEDALSDDFDSNMKQKTDWILCDYFPLLDGKQADYINPKIRHVFENLKSNLNGHDIPIILTSDNHDFRNYESDNRPLSFYKGLPTFKGLKMCISDFEQRVSGTNKIYKNPYISKIELINEKKPSEIQIITFSNAFNCVIGGRSSGKSFLLRKIFDGSTNDAENKKILKEYKHLSDISIKVYDASGKVYVGKPDFYSQGEIIDKYNKENNGLSLQQEFKEYFPNSLDSGKVVQDKFNIKNDLIEFDKCLQNISQSKKDIENRKFLDYLRIDSTKNFAFISCQDIESRVDKLNNALNGLKLFKTNVSNNLHLIASFKDLTDQASKLIENVEDKIQKMSKWKIVYDKILDCSRECISKINEKMSDVNKRKNSQVLALRSIISVALEYCNNNEKARDLIDKVKEKIKNLKKSETVSNVFGQFKFSIKLTNNLNLTALQNCLTDYIKISEKKTKNFETLISYINDYGYERYLTKNLETMISNALDESYSLEFLIHENGELINEMSEGRKVSVFLNLLLSKNDTIEPLIVDQPEDDMDNADIYKILVKTIRETKSKRQIIFATHDSNVVVNGDAENVIYANKKKRNFISYQNGALEYEDDGDFNVQKIICNTLEGGEKAFVIRANKYDINKLELYQWRNNNAGNIE